MELFRLRIYNNEEMKYLLKKFTKLTIFIAVTMLIVLYSEGWRINTLSRQLAPENEQNNQVFKTGMLAVRSVPEGAKVFLDDESVTATDDTINSLKTGQYKLRLEKEGYERWEKEINVYEDKVTDITAVLILQSPKLEPLTNLNISKYAISNNSNSIVFISKNNNVYGLWMLPLNANSINIFRNQSYELATFPATFKLQDADELIWSPDDKEVYIKNGQNISLIYSFNQPTKIATIQNIQNYELVQEAWIAEWQQDFLADKIEIINKQGETLDKILPIDQLDQTFGHWSPDAKKFFFMVEKSSPKNSAKLYDVYSYNLDEPLPIDESRLNRVLTDIDLNLYFISWYSDSYHLIISEKPTIVSNEYTLKLIRIDGENMTNIYNGFLSDQKAYATPDGDKITVLTTLKKDTPNNLYGISIR
ncbi:MAG: PEGA domain-containing protein [Niabella sp.]|nr:MAG: PEGA domain-containing protein [Niabella sp.]